jgi:hypothetical protein
VCPYFDPGKEGTKGGVRMNDVIGIAWYKDKATYRRALAIFTDPKNMPATYEDWQALVGREREEIKGAGNIALAWTSIRKHLKIGAMRMDFYPIRRVEWRSSTMSSSRMRRPAKE